MVHGMRRIVDPPRRECRRAVERGDADAAHGGGSVRGRDGSVECWDEGTPSCAPDEPEIGEGVHRVPTFLHGTRLRLRRPLRRRCRLQQRELGRKRTLCY